MPVPIIRTPGNTDRLAWNHEDRLASGPKFLANPLQLSQGIQAVLQRTVGNCDIDALIFDFVESLEHRKSVLPRPRVGGLIRFDPDLLADLQKAQDFPRAASKIQYPVAGSDKCREVTHIGEGAVLEFAMP